MCRFLAWAMCFLMLAGCSTPVAETEMPTIIKQLEVAKDPVSLYQQAGLRLTDTAFTILSKILQNAMQNGGPITAISVCNQRATSILDSLSELHGAVIERTSLKLRNSSNAPDSLEREILLHYSKQWPKGDLQPLVVNTGQDIRFFRPIGIKPMCLTCHGQTQGLLADELRRRYPSDSAKGYVEGDFRGMWSVVFKDKKYGEF